MSLDDDAVFFSSRPQRLPFRFAGRMSDEAREDLGQWAAQGEDDLLASWLAGTIWQERVPMTPEERDIVVAGLRWNDLYVEDEEEKADYTWLERHPIVSPAEVEVLVARWRFEPAGPADDAVEQAAVDLLRQLEGARALLTAWRLSPEGERVRAYCIVGAPGASLSSLWVRTLYAMQSANDGTLLARSGVVLEAVIEGEVWPPYHRRLVRAAAPVWVAEGVALDLGGLLADQPEPLEVVRLGDNMVFFPGPPDHDAVDTAVTSWAAYRDHVVALTRCWAQRREGDEARLRVYGVVVDDAAEASRAREETAEVVRRAVGGQVGIEVVEASGELPERDRRVLDASVVLWPAEGR
ncbi:MAG: hypothetical protein M3N68_14690 [Actinomycetota bacterium]|nr:hypothetical protein [Actinomycetota bacterium]